MLVYSTLPIHWHLSWHSVLFSASSERATVQCDSQHTHSASLPLQKRMLLTLELKLTMEPAYYYRNFYSSKPLPAAQRLVTMNARMNANELALQRTTGINNDLHVAQSFLLENQDQFDLQFPIGARARSRRNMNSPLEYQILYQVYSLSFNMLEQFSARTKVIFHLFTVYSEKW